MGAGPKPFLIRTARLSDAVALSAMMIKSWRESYDGIIEPTKLDEICTIWLTPQKFKERLSDKDACNLIAEADAQVVGHCYALPRGNNSILIAYLYVRQSHQRCGIGQTLMNAAIDCFPGIKHVELGVLAHNYNAIQFYKSLGFFEAGPEPKRLDEPPSIKMTKAL